MATIKARKQGNSIMITIPSTLGVEVGAEFFFIKKENGAITLIPKEEDHFKHVAPGAYHLPELDVGYAPSGEELDEI